MARLAVNRLKIVSCLEKFSRVPSYCDMAIISKDCRIAYILFVAELSSSGDFQLFVTRVMSNIRSFKLDSAGSIFRLCVCLAQCRLNRSSFL